MLPNLIHTFAGFTLLFQLLTVNAAIEPSNFVAPTAASPFRSQSGKQRAILPYSLYQRRLEEQSRLKNQTKPLLTSSATHQDNNEVSDGSSSRRVSIYLPAFKNANESQIAQVEADALQSRKAMMNRLNSSEAVNDAEYVSSSNDSRERTMYSTNTRQPLPYHKSIFRPKTNSIVTVNQPHYQLNQSAHNPIVKYNPKPLSEKLTESTVPERPPFVNVPSLRGNMFVNGIPLEGSTGLNQMRQPSPGNNAMIDQPYQPKPVYSNLAPAPYSTLSSDPSSQNLIESIFSQSQTPVRYAPSNANLASLAQPSGIQSSLNPLQALANTANSLGGPEMLSQFLGGGGGSPLEQISKLARNLLSLPSGNPELLSALTKSLATNTVSEGSKLSSSAVIQPGSAVNAVASGAKSAAGLSANAADILFSNAKDEDNNSNATTKLLKTLPEDQRALLEAAIQNGEINSENLTPTLGSLVKDKSILKSENRLLEWIQQNRPRASEREADGSALAVGDKLPYFGRYCGSFVEQANATKKHDNSGAKTTEMVHEATSQLHGLSGSLWAVDERRLIVSKFHFKPGSKTENVTFWLGPANETGTPSDVFPNDNGFYLQPRPVDLNVFMNQQVEVKDANVRAQMQKDEPVIAAEIEEMEDEAGKTLPESEVTRSKREATKTVASVPLHFEASANQTDKSVHLTVTNPNTETTTATSIDDDQSHILISATNKEVAFGKETTESKNQISSFAPLDWYAGFQPLLLTLPEGRSIRTLHWVAIYNHKKKESVAFVLIPNGIAFQIPAVVQLRPLTPNGSYKVSSGAIKALDTKTIEIEDFSLETDGMAVWFLVGKEIVPHGEGQIVPVFDKDTKQFDCNSLRDYKNETLTLRLPGQVDIKDVFWFSVFSITKSVSLSHLYVPYNDLHLPPDLLGISTPRCVYKPTSKRV